LLAVAVGLPLLVQSWSVRPLAASATVIGGIGEVCDADGNNGTADCFSPCLDDFSICKNGNTNVCETFTACDMTGCTRYTGGEARAPKPKCR